MPFFNLEPLTLKTPLHGPADWLLTAKDVETSVIK